METPWHAVQVMTNHEKRVAQYLTARCLDNYVPLYTQQSHWTDRIVTLERPLFPGYVFIRFDFKEKLSVLTTPGVLHLIGSGPGDTVPAAEIESIRAALAGGYPLRPHPRLDRGMCVRIQHGIFAGVTGIVTELRHPCKVILALSAVEQSFSLEVRREDIEVVDPATASLSLH